jgi:hypothetical protein
MSARFLREYGALGDTRQELMRPGCSFAESEILKRKSADKFNRTEQKRGAPRSYTFGEPSFFLLNIVRIMTQIIMLIWLSINILYSKTEPVSFRDFVFWIVMVKFLQESPLLLCGLWNDVLKLTGARVEEQGCRCFSFFLLRSHENSKSQKSKKVHNKINSENSFFKKRLSLYK